MAEPTRTGVRAGLAKSQTPCGTSSSVIVTVDEHGTELSRESVPDEPGIVLDVVHFVDLDDGSRVTTEALGAMALSIPRTSTLADVRDELHEFAEEARWEDMTATLQAHGISADDQRLLSLPFVIELGDEVRSVLERQ